MTGMRASDSSDPGGVSGDGQPVVNGRTNFAALNWGRSGPMMSGNQKNNALPGVFCALKGDIDRTPCLVQIEPVEIHDAIGLDGA